MYLFLIGVIVLEVFQISNGCTCVCAICGSLPMTDPPTSPGTARGPGRVTETMDANGCKSYTVTCDAMGTNYVVIGANQQFIQLSPAGPGAKSATLFCDDDEKIEGSDLNGNSISVSSVYCSYALPGGK